MLNIHSHDNTSGNIYDGTWTLSRIINGKYEMIYHHFDTGDVPIIYTGCDELHIDVASSVTIINLTATSDDTKATIATDIQTQIQTVSGLGAATCTYNSATDEFDISSGTTFKILWSLSNARFLFDEAAVDSSDTGTHNLSARHVDSRPNVLELHIDEASNTGASTRSTFPDLVISLDDVLIKQQEITLTSSTSSLDIQFYRINVTATAIPFTNEWHMIWKALP